MFITGETNFSSYMNNAPEKFFDEFDKNLKYFSSDDIVFERDVKLLFPFTFPFLGQIGDSGDKSYLTLNIKQGSFSNHQNIEITSNNLKTYTNSDSEAIEYLLFNINLPSGLAGEVSILADMFIEGEIELSFKRTTYFMPKLSIRLSSSDSIITSSENPQEGDRYKGTLVLSHSPKIRPAEYRIAPFQINGIEDIIETSDTFLEEPIKIENTNIDKTNVYFEFEPDILPRPTIQSRGISSNNLDVEFLLQTLPGIDYETIIIDGNNVDVTEVPKYFNITRVGNWEFWAVFPNINYTFDPPENNTKPSTVTPTGDDIRPLIFIKNNARFTNSILVYDIGGLMSYRFPWTPSSVDNNQGIDDIWKELLDNSRGAGQEEDLPDKIKRFYFVESTNPFIPVETGFTLNFLFRHSPDLNNPSEFIDTKLFFNIKNDDFLDIILEVDNKTLTDVLKVGKFQTFNLWNAFDFSDNWTGRPGLSKFIKFFNHIKYNDPTNSDPDKRFEWIPDEKSGDRDLPFTKNNLGKVFDIENGNTFIPTSLDITKSTIRTRANALFNGGFENDLSNWFLVGSASGEIKNTNSGDDPAIVYAGDKSLMFSHLEDVDGYFQQQFNLTEDLLDKRLWFSYRIKSAAGLSSIAFTSAGGINDLSVSSIETPFEDTYTITITSPTTFQYEKLGDGGPSGDITITTDPIQLGNNEVFIEFGGTVSHVTGDEWVFSTIENTETTRTTMNGTSEVEPTSGDADVEYDNVEWKQITGYFDVADTGITTEDQVLTFIIRPTETSSNTKVFIDKIEIRIINTSVETPPDPTKDFKFENSEADPRWYNGESLTGSRGSVVLPNPEDSDTDWPYLNPSAVVPNDRFNTDSKIEPFFVGEVMVPNVNFSSGTMGIVAQNSYAAYYNVGETPQFRTVSNGFFIVGEVERTDDTSNEYLTRYAPLAGIPLIRAGGRERTITRVYFDNQNGTREGWLENVYKDIDFEERVEYGTSSSSSGVSESFINEMDVVVKSFINNRSSLDQNKIFKSRYKYISPNDIIYALNSDAGSAIPGKISLKDGSFDLNIIQKTNFLYQKIGDSDLVISENISKIKIDNNFISLPALDSTITQQNTGANAKVLDVIVLDDGTAEIYVDNIKKKFNNSDSIDGTDIDNVAISLTPTSDAFSPFVFDHTFIKTVTKDNSSRTISDDIFLQGFDRSYPVLQLDGNIENEPLKIMSEDIFEGGNLIYPTDPVVSSAEIISNRAGHIIIKGRIKKRLDNIDFFAITIYDPNRISLDFTSGGYQSQFFQLKKRAISSDGNLLFHPIKVTLEEGKPTEILASIRDTSKKFGGFSRIVNIAGETVFDVTGVTESQVQIFAYADVEENPVLDDANPKKIPLSIGGKNLSKVIIPENLKDRQLLLQVKTAIPAENVRAIMDKKDGTEEEFPTIQTISNQEFIIKIEQEGRSYNNISIDFNPLFGSSLDVLGVVETDTEGGISLEDDVIDAVGFKADGYDETTDKFTFNGFESILFATSPSELYKRRITMKYSSSEAFNNNALMHSALNQLYASDSPSVTPIPIPQEKSIWVKNGSENITNLIEYDSNAFGFNSKMFIKNKISFIERNNEIITRIDYIYRGEQPLYDVTIFHSVNLNFLLDFLPPSLKLPSNPEDINPNYNEEFASVAQKRFFFKKIDTNQFIGFSSESNDQGLGVIYPVEEEGGLLYENVENNLNAFEVKQGESEKVKRDFFFEKSDRSGGIQGTLYSKETVFEKSVFRNDHLGEISGDPEEFPHPFLGYTNIGDTLVYGIGIPELPTNHGYSFGIKFKFLEGSTKEDIL